VTATKKGVVCNTHRVHQIGDLSIFVPKIVSISGLSPASLDMLAVPGKRKRATIDGSLFASAVSVRLVFSTEVYVVLRPQSPMPAMLQCTFIPSP